MTTNVLGINCGGFHSSAALFMDGLLRYAICEERLSRIKQDRAFPVKAIKYVCDAAGIDVSEVEHVAIGWNPAAYMYKSDKTYNDAMQNRGKMAYLAQNEMAVLTGAKQLACMVDKQRISFVDHHVAHAYSVLPASGFSKCDVMVIDGFGENTAGFVGQYTDGVLLPALAHNRYPHSLGMFYAAFTEYCGFKPYGEEWKAMALAAAGDKGRYYHKIKQLVQLDGLRYWIDLSYFEYFMFFTPHMYSERLCELLGPPCAEVNQRTCDIMAAVQAVVEETVFAIGYRLQTQTGKTKLVVSGGFFMNSVLNGKLHKAAGYDEVYIGGYPDDSGTSIGAGAYASMLLGCTPRIPHEHDFFGANYGGAVCGVELQRRKIPHTRCSTRQIAETLVAGKIVGLFTGESEFGQRALGHRSILADPRHASTKDLVNASVKYREGFRPFAPAVIDKYYGDIFDHADQPAFFMERVLPISAEWRDRLQAVDHHGTGRAQLVTRNNTVLYDVIKHFYDMTGVPVLLNTSFNVNGMPLVETPADALDCFYACGIDILVLEDYMVTK